MSTCAIRVNGLPASVEYKEQKHRIVKSCLAELFGEAGNRIPALYGCINPGNTNELIQFRE